MAGSPRSALDNKYSTAVRYVLYIGLLGGNIIRGERVKVIIREIFLMFIFSIFDIYVTGLSIHISIFKLKFWEIISETVNVAVVVCIVYNE